MATVIILYHKAQNPLTANDHHTMATVVHVVDHVIGLVYVSATGLLLILQVIYEYGEPRWNDTDRGKPKNSEKNLPHCHFVHHKSRMD
jgi:hypothetical protein